MSDLSNKVYYMEQDGAVKIPDKFDRMNYAEISAECARLSEEKLSKVSREKREKGACKTKFAI